MRFSEWKAIQDGLDKEGADLQKISDALYKRRDVHRNKLCLMYTLPSGTRTTISGLTEARLQITAANEHGFLTLGMLSIADQRVFLEITEAIAAWKRGELDDLPWPAYEFAPWPGVKRP